MDKLGLADHPVWNWQDDNSGVGDHFGTGDHLVRAFWHRNYAIGMHTHNFPEVNIVTGGRGLHCIGEMVIEVQPGDVFVMTPDVMHGYVDEGRLDVYHLLLSPAFMQRYRRELEGMPGYARMFAIEPYLRQVYDEKLFLHLQPMALDALRGDLEEMARTECEGLHVCTSVVALHLILRLCGLAMEAPQAASAEILEVMSYIRAHPDADLTLPALAKTARMSRSTFCRQFEKIVRISPGEYVRRCRTELARRMLAEGKENRTEIALSCGFYDLSHMNRCLQAEKQE